MWVAAGVRSVASAGFVRGRAGYCQVVSIAQPPLSGTVACWFSADGRRRRYAQPLVAVVLAVVIAVFAVVALSAVTAYRSDAVVRLGVVGIVLTAGLVTWRVCGTALIVDDRVLTIRTVCGSRSVDAGELAGFEPAKPYGTLTGNGIRVQLRDGSILASGTFTTTPVYGQGGTAQVAELNAWLADVRAGGPTPAALTRAPVSVLDRANGPAWWTGLTVLVIAWALVLMVALGALVSPASIR